MSAQPSSLLPWLQLSLVPGLGAASLRRLLAAIESPVAVLAASAATLAHVVDPALARAICAGPDPRLVDTALDWMNAPHRAILARDDPRYPALLSESPDPPAVIYAAGRSELLQSPAIAIVGSRNASAQGMRNAEDFARTLSDAGLCVVSGLALGIDTAAHRGGLAGPGSSIAVLGNGVDVIYPKRNAETYAALQENGLLISEFPLGTAPIATNFPRRNRIISGLARGCLVVEAALASGSLITARLAVDLGRDVFAIPGSIHSPLAKGCHHLIKQGAKLVDCAADILEELRLPVPTTIRLHPENDLDADAVSVLNALGYDSSDLDSIASRCGMPVQRLLSVLIQLELHGHVSVVPGGRYQRLS